EACDTLPEVSTNWFHFGSIFEIESIDTVGAKGSKLLWTKISLVPYVLSCQATEGLPLSRTPIWRFVETDSVLLRLIMLPNVEPPSELDEKKISKLSVSLCCDMTTILFPVTII